MKRLVVINIILVLMFFILPKETEADRKEADRKEVQKLVQEVYSSRSGEARVEENDIIEPKIILATEVSEEGINLIKEYEGLKLEAYKLEGEEYFTIGYGHYGSDVREGQKITAEEAERLLKADITGYTDYILKHCEYLELKQNELDALVSFTYNCGLGSLNKLTDNKTRNKEEIAEHITAYTKSSSESNRKGLAERRVAEKELFIGEGV